MALHVIPVSVSRINASDTGNRTDSATRARINKHFAPARPRAPKDCNTDSTGSPTMSYSPTLQPHTSGRHAKRQWHARMRSRTHARTHARTHTHAHTHTHTHTQHALSHTQAHRHRDRHRQSAHTKRAPCAWLSDTLHRWHALRCQT